MPLLTGWIASPAMVATDIGCSGSSDDGGGASVNGDAALKRLMQTVAFDLAKVMAEVATLSVERLDLSASLPEPTDAFTHDVVRATTEEGESLCAWSGSNSCDDILEPF